MKKIKTYIVLLLCAILLSCTEYVGNNVLQESEPKVIENLTSYNDSLMLSSKKTRVSTRRLLYYLSVASADAGGAYNGGQAGLKVGALIGQPHIGAAIGAVCCGGYASYMCHRLLSDANVTRGVSTPNLNLKAMDIAAAYAPVLSEEKVIEKNRTDNIYLNDVSVDIKDIGAKHNLLLSNLQTNHFEKKSVKENLTSEELCILNSDEFEIKMDSTVNQLQMSVQDGKIVQISGNDIPAKVMNLFFEIFTNYPNDENDVGMVVSRYLKEIDLDASFSELDRILIRQALSVAVSSFEYWSNYDKNN
ncbi:glycine zipper family protein [Segatella copri]|uniref:glycine zipper family protein n=2 Tax=Segatella copri TaxID=165179 RepID=UPI001183D0B7|nr:glycine zipper family protein [Segatella copri]